MTQWLASEIQRKESCGTPRAQHDPIGTAGRSRCLLTVDKTEFLTVSVAISGGPKGLKAPDCSSFARGFCSSRHPFRRDVHCGPSRHHGRHCRTAPCLTQQPCPVLTTQQARPVRCATLLVVVALWEIGGFDRGKKCKALDAKLVSMKRSGAGKKQSTRLSLLRLCFQATLAMLW